MAEEPIDLDKATPEQIYRAIYDDPRVVAAKVELAEQAAEYARSIAPVKTGKYRDSIKVRRKGATVWVGFEAPHSHLVEYGAEHTPEYAVRAKTEEHFND